MFAYTVRCTFQSVDVLDEWIAWLRDEHLRDVAAGGARSAEVFRLDGADLVCEVRYLFDDRTAFDRYERDVAPALRDEGLKHFPLERGLTYARSTGERVASL